MDKWIKIGIAESLIWFLFIFLWSEEGLHLGRMFVRRYFEFWDDGALTIIVGCVVLWVISYLFYRDKK
jgi:hypothetical protein